MFKLVLFLCFSFGFVTGKNFENQTLNLCNASISGKPWLSTKVTSQTENSKDSETFPSSGMTSIPTDLLAWTEFPVLPLAFASSNTLPEGRCKKQVRRYLQDLANSTLWAVQMFDASTKYPDGVIYGNTKHLGNFDQCYNIRTKLPPHENVSEHEEEVEGRYCLIRFRYQRKDVVPTRPQFFDHEYDPNLSAWDAIDYRGDARRAKRDSVYMALCVPASCSAEEVAAAISEPLENMADARGISLKIKVKPSYCQARSDIPENFSTGTKAFCIIIAALFVLVIGSSWYDNSFYSAEEAANDNESKEFLLCFSARRNLRSIFATSDSHPGLECIHFIRFFFMVGVIFGHRMMHFYGFPVINAIYLEKAYSIPGSMILFHGPIVVDGFFSLGGLLLAYGLLEELDKRKRMHFTALILARFLRLTPLYMIVVFFHATLLPLIGSGPFWESRIGADRDYCAKNWWTNLLYINNYVNSKEMSWYLSVDYHLYIMGLFVIYTFWRLPRRLGYLFLGGLLAIGIAIPCFVTYKQNLKPLFVGMPFMTNVRKDSYFVEQYIKSHHRIGPYMVGVLAGVIVYDHKGATWRLSKTLSRLLYILLAVGLAVSSQALGAKYFDPNSVLNPLETALYAGFHRAAFALGICSIVVLITIGDGLDFCHKFMTPRWIPPLARLTYGAFLTHNLHQGYQIGTTRTAIVFSLHNNFWNFVPDVVYTFSLSLVMSIVAEGPIRKIEKFMLTRRARKNPTERSSSNGIKKTN